MWCLHLSPLLVVTEIIYSLALWLIKPNYNPTASLVCQTFDKPVRHDLSSGERPIRRYRFFGRSVRDPFFTQAVSDNS